MTTYNKELEKYVPFVSFLGQALGNNCEIVLHDLSDKKNSIIAIHNNHITNRKIGDPPSEIVMKIIENDSNKRLNFITNYTKSKSNRLLKSNTMFIRNKDSEIIGLFCINMDNSSLDRIQNEVNEYLKLMKFNLKDHQNTKLDLIEDVEISIEDRINSAVNSILNRKKLIVENLDQDDRIIIVDELYQIGIFLLKGAVKVVAKSIDSSEASIYRYLQQVKSK